MYDVNENETIGNQSETQSATDPIPGYQGIIGAHPSMERVFSLIRKVGPSQTPVLVTGESGTGKELVARALHDLSRRHAKSLVPVHCGAIPEELLESELFGHVKGAFTGALAARTGRFQLADKGTIFLDEIGEMSPQFQVKLLRVLENGSFDPVGSTQTMHTDTRIVAATHRDLTAMAEEGSFREDLLYRLDVVRIHLPALRERKEDIPLIAEHQLRQLEQERDMPRFQLSAEAQQALQAFDWPGNVRQLRNVLERAAVLAEQPGIIGLEDLPDAIQECAGAPNASTETSESVSNPWDFDAQGSDFRREMEEFERRMIGRALQISGGSKREAARLLQINRTTLIEKLKRRGWEFREGALEPKPTEATTQWPKLGPAPATRPLSEPQPMPTALAAQAG